MKLAFFEFNIGTTLDKKAGGTGVFVASIRKLLDIYDENDKIILKIIPLIGADSIKDHKFLKIVKVFKLFFFDIVNMLREKSDIFLFVYPKMPVVAFTDKIEYMPLAIFGYVMLNIIKRIKKIKIAIIIEELIIEVDITNQIEPSWYKKHFTFLKERFIFCTSDILLCPSKLMSDYVRKKYKLTNKKWIIYPRDMYLPLKDEMPRKQISVSRDKINVLYSGGLEFFMKEIIYKILYIFETSPNSFLYLCGINGGWVHSIIKNKGFLNSRYIGILNYSEHDILASQCDFGLIVYPENSHYDFKPTTKYCAYVANGIPVLSHNLKTLSEILKNDGTGKAVPSKYFLIELYHWLENPQSFSTYKQRAIQVKNNYLRGEYMHCWMDELLQHIKLEQD